jgi:hypothetical protein
VGKAIGYYQPNQQAVDSHSLRHFSSTREIIHLATTVCQSIDYAIGVPLLILVRASCCADLHS